MANEPRTHNDYTIGWVCALSKEQTAAIAMLDERHDDLPRLPNDNNIYALGSIGGHNIVIACLPKGKLGTVSAATVAIQMINAFPAIKFGLMVGIGGGISVKVRLGDIVVGTPIGEYPGVVQWDLGKEGNEFRRTGSLNNPPSLLLGAVSRLMTEHELGGSKVSAYMNEMVTRYPPLASNYLKSESLVDIRFKAKYEHKNKNGRHATWGDADRHSEEEDEEEEEEEENSCRYCDKTQVVKRKPRSQGMLVHYGLIASGNRVIKNAMFRDKLRKDLRRDVLCVEMEAAGLMDNFPCIVIRGICDYADSHKNDDWQEHAAAMAAAFAKDLLGYVQPIDINREATAKDILDNISITVSSINENLTRTRHYLDKKEDIEILDWLTQTDYGSQQTDYLGRRQPETGEWLLASNEYQDWIKESGKTLFCPGIPGAGKTILASIVVNDLEAKFEHDPTIAVSYVYCNYKRQNEQTVENLLSSLLKQLARSHPSLPESVKKIYDKHKSRSTKPSLHEISEALRAVTAQSSRVFIVIDALDECQASDGCRSRFMPTIWEIQAETRANVLVTSRPIPEIEKQFKSMTSIEIRANKGDIRRYLRDHMSELCGFIVNELETQNKIMTTISEEADGMFLLAQLYFDSLKGKDTVRAISKALVELKTRAKSYHAADKPTKKYDTAYDHAMERIEGQLKDQATRAKQVLSWITCAKRPLTKLELQHALAVQIDEPHFDKENIPQAADFVSVCAGLVTIDEESNTVRLVHYTTQDYFVRNQGKWFPDAHLSMDFKSGYAKTDAEFQQRLQSYPLYSYAANAWGHHARKASVHPRIVSFLLQQTQVEVASQALIPRGYYITCTPMEMARLHLKGLHLTAYFGKHDVNVTDNDNRTALWWATRYGHQTVVKLLLTTDGIDPNLTDTEGLTPLHYAVRDENEAITKLLLANERYAMEKESEAMVKLLLTNERVDPNLKNATRGETPLQHGVRFEGSFKGSFEGRCEGIVKVLLTDDRVDPNVKNERGETPLHTAVYNKSEAMVRLLLANERLDFKPETFDSALLILALRARNGAILRMLFTDQRIDPSINDTTCWTRLHHDVYKKYETFKWSKTRRVSSEAQEQSEDSFCLEYTFALP
ncbi:hypothetical protein F4859DRAFT_528751 [Xylaria cf. heliscus]|nr:hypothetical protein F4859DRAFT_528751 [Xylaria cf. heliscus]